MEEYYKTLDKVVIYFTTSDYGQNVELAKKDFFGYLLPSDENSHQFDIKMSQFLDWYIFDYHLRQTGLTPLEEVIKSKEVQKSLSINEGEFSLLESLSHHHHSLFELIKVCKDSVIIKDLVTNKKTQVGKTLNISYLKKNECFEGRIVLIDQVNQALNGICVHPIEAKKFIMGQVNSVRKLGECEQKEVFRKLARMYFKLHQFPHIKMEYIYTDDGKMRF